MKSVVDFVGGFLRRDGLFVLISSLVLKLSNLFLSIYVVRMISSQELGEITYAMSIIGMLTVFAGFGSNWSLLRFGAIQKGFLQKHKLLKYSIDRGLWFSFILIIVVFGISFILPEKVKYAQYFLIILSLEFITTFLFELIKSYLRIIGKNKIYSKTNIRNSILLLLLSFVLVYLFRSTGYVLAVVIAPFISFCFYYRHISIKNTVNLTINVKEYVKYGIYTGIGVIANQALITSGPIIAGFFTDGNDLALLRVATIIPYNLMFIPSLIMTTDFVYFSKNYDNRRLLKEYYVDYVKTILIITIIPFCILFLYSEEIILLLYGAEYVRAASMSFYLNIAIFFVFIFRIPLGNILSAVGKAKWNVIHAIFCFIIFVPLSVLLFKVLGIEGIAISISIVFILSGFISLFLFTTYLKTLK